MGLSERVMWTRQRRVCLFYLILLFNIYEAKTNEENMNFKVYENQLCESVNCMKSIPFPAERNKKDREEHSGPLRGQVKRNKIVRMMKRRSGRFFDLKIFQN